VIAKGNRVVAYLRVSSEDQSANGVSLDAQRHRIRAYCEAHALNLVQIETDQGISAKATTNRPGLQRTLELLHAGKASGVVVIKLDRLTRSLRDVIDLIARAEREGWQLHSIGENLDTSTPHGKFVVHLFGALAQLEREQVGERTRIAMGELRRQGRKTSSKAPFGYRHEKRRLVPVPSEQKILARLLALRAEGLGCVKLTRALNAEGPNPRVRRPWNVGVVRAILRTVARREASTGSGPR